MVCGQVIKRTQIYWPEHGSSGDGLQTYTVTNTKVTSNSCIETNIACPSAVTISRFAYNSPNAVLIAVMWNTVRVKRPTRDLVQAAAGAKSSRVIRGIKASNARGARAQTRS